MEENKLDKIVYQKRKNSAWSVGLPVLHVLIFGYLTLAALGCWDSSSCAENVNSVFTIAKYLMIGSAIFSVILYNRSKKGIGRKYGIAALIIGLIVPLLSLWSLLN